MTPPDPQRRQRKRRKRKPHANLGDVKVGGYGPDGCSCAIEAVEFCRVHGDTKARESANATHRQRVLQPVLSEGAAMIDPQRLRALCERAKLSLPFTVITEYNGKTASENVDALRSENAGLRQDRQMYLCEQHPFTVWPHGDCAGPGVLVCSCGDCPQCRWCRHRVPTFQCEQCTDAAQELAAAREEIARLESSLRDVRERKDQRIVELIQQQTAAREEIARLTQALDAAMCSGCDQTIKRGHSPDCPTQFKAALICECPGFTTKGPYPSGICPECKRWYPPKGAE